MFIKTVYVLETGKRKVSIGNDMSLWFDRNNQEKIFQQYLPTGKAYKQASVEGSNFNKIIKWISFNFQWLVDRYNRVFKALYVCEGNYLVEKWKTDYNIPNSVFYLSEEENRTDVFVLRYLMKGNTSWHFQAIANIYGVDVNITSAKDFFQKSRLPSKIPHKLYGDIKNVTNVMSVNFFATGYDPLPHPIPHKLGIGKKLEKIKKIYQIIKEAQCNILYLPMSSTVISEDVKDILPTNIPHILGVKQISKIIYNNVEKDDRINFCKGTNL